MRCVGKRKQQERDEFVRNNRREVDRYAGFTDPMEIIREFHTWRKPDPLVIYKPTTKNAASLYAELTEEQRDLLVTVAATEKRAGNSRFAEAVATSMATLTDNDLTALKNHRFEPALRWLTILVTLRHQLRRYVSARSLHRRLVPFTRNRCIITIRKEAV